MKNSLGSLALGLGLLMAAPACNPAQTSVNPDSPNDLATPADMAPIPPDLARPNEIVYMSFQLVHPNDDGSFSIWGPGTEMSPKDEIWVTGTTSTDGFKTIEQVSILKMENESTVAVIDGNGVNLTRTFGRDGLTNKLVRIAIPPKEKGWTGTVNLDMSGVNPDLSPGWAHVCQRLSVAIAVKDAPMYNRTDEARDQVCAPQPGWLEM